MTGNSTYTGATTIAGGALRVNGSLGNTAVTVSNGGTLGGSGLIAGPVMVGGGGIVAPGNSIGTLTLSGNLVQASGSIYQVELNATGQADHLIVAVRQPSRAARQCRRFNSAQAHMFWARAIQF